MSSDGRAIAMSLRSPEAFADIFDRHFVLVHRYIARRAGTDVADEIAAQTFTLAFANRDRYRDDLGTARPWLLGIATNLLHEQWRRERRHANVVERLWLEADQRWSTSATATADAATDDDGRLGAALAALSADQRDALLMHVWGELSYAEIAQTLGVPIGTVRSRISRACAALRPQLDPPATTAGERSNDA
jgi:RNA polymerase sigma factor (sigma-70 family)